ncbi:T9SS type B sorting domain-containing protein, partial [Flavobacterium sp. SM15]|uniref:PKD-like domain-containing protein n=1 Tax=Flavobacterium sp. SM15 TaxID=2908005 RepID=UPI001EDA5AE0
SPVSGTTFAWTVAQSGVSGAVNGSGTAIAQSLTTTGAAIGTATYTVTPTANGCSGTPFTVVVTVNPIPTGSATPPSDTICSASAPNIVLSGPVSGTTFDWTVAATGVSGAFNGSGATIDQVLTATGTTNGTVTYTVTPRANGCNGTPFTVVVTVKPTPTGSATPPSDTICSGTTPSILLNGPVAGTTFDWTVTSSGVSGASNGSGATIAQTLTTTGSATGTVTYTITPKANGCNGAPFDVIVTVNSIPDVVATPNAQTICSGLTTGIGLSGAVTGTTFDWTVVQSGVSGASNGSGVSIAQALTTTGTANGTATYTITPKANGCTGTPIQVVITVLSSPSATISVTGTNPICAGSTSQITITGNGNTTVEYTVNGTPASIAIPAIGSVSFTTAALTAQTTYQLVSISAGPGCTYPISTAAAVVNIAPQPTASISIPQTICNGSSTIVTFTGTAGATVSYTVNGTSQAVLIEPDGNTDVATGILTVDTTYQLVNVTAGVAPNCVEPLTGSTLITVVPVPTVTALPTSQSLCSGQSTGIQLQGLPNTTFSWTVATTGGVTGASNGTGNIISQVLTAGTVVGTVTYTITPKIGSCSGAPVTVVVTVNPTPVLTITNSAASICTGSSTNITFTSNIPGTTYSWNAVQVGATGSSSGTGSSIQQVLTATGINSGEVAYNVTPLFNGCPGASKTVIVKVNPIPVVTATPTSQTICSGTATGIALTSNVPNTTFTWVVTQSQIIGTSAGSGNTIAQTLTTIGTVQGTANYIITPHANGCDGAPITVTVNVNPVPEVFTSTGITTICSGSETNISLSALIPATTFNWTVTQNGVSGASNGTGDLIKQELETTGNQPGQAIYVITPSAAGCNGTSITVIITVNPLPKPQLKSGYICVNPNTGDVISTYTLDAQIDNSSNAYTFYWYHDGNLVETSGNSTYLVQYEDNTVNHGVGSYTVIVKNNATGCETDPLDAPVVDVVVSLGAVSWSYIVSDYFEDDQAITVTVNGSGSYLYSLDGGPFQTSNVFPHVLPGEHYVTINDENGCTDETIEHILTIGYPHFFTPNGDSYNDYWNITSLKGTLNNGDAEIQIFDRYGKLMMVTTPDGAGWDGTLNGQPLPATDYWFTVKYDENGVEKLFKAHFSLKR